jgi:lipocalin
MNSTHVSVRNGGKNKDSGKDDYLNGYANIINLNEPNKLLVHLPIIIGGVQVYMNSGQYNVLETDYKTYTVIYSCTELPFGFKKEIAWIMTREKTVDDALVQRIQTEWKGKGVNTNEFIKIDHSCQ